MLEIREIRKSYGETAVLLGASLRMEPGVWLGLAGRNGCGKSTLLGIAAQVLPSDGGDILCGGVSVLGDRRFLRKKLGYVPQEDALCDFLTVEQQLALWRSAVEAADPETEQLLDLGEIAKKRIDRLSGGQRKRLSIAMALQTRPEYLIMDEAFSSLDTVYRERLAQWITQQCARGMSVLWCSHDTGELERLCTRLCALRGGVIVPLEQDNTRQGDQ